MSVSIKPLWRVSWLWSKRSSLFYRSIGDEVRSFLTLTTDDSKLLYGRTDADNDNGIRRSQEPHQGPML